MWGVTKLDGRLQGKKVTWWGVTKNEELQAMFRLKRDAIEWHLERESE